MALVGYSDSEGSDDERAPATSKPMTTASSSFKPSFQKVNDASGPRKIRVELPSLPTTAEEQTLDDRPAKKAKTGGGFDGFNALLPAPKRTAETAKKPGLGSGVSLKTSSNAAFSRETKDANTPNDEHTPNDRHLGDFETGGDTASQTHTEVVDSPKLNEDVKVVGNAMRFKPLSVANKKKPIKKTMIPGMVATEPATKVPEKAPQRPEAVSSKPKVSLFSVTQEEKSLPETRVDNNYEPMMSYEIHEQDPEQLASTSQYEQRPVNANSVDAIASDLNLSAADRRRLFGRNAKADVQALNIASFDMDAEYRKNEELRAAGEVVEHRAVKAIAPGKHSLQQLVNAASTQREALEDAWAQGKRNRGEAGSKYGW